MPNLSSDTRRGCHQRFHLNAATLVTPTVRMSGAKLSHDQQRAMSREWKRASAHRARENSPKSGGFKSHDDISRERTERRTACHSHATRRVAAGMGGGARAGACEGKGPYPCP